LGLKWGVGVSGLRGKARGVVERWSVGALERGSVGAWERGSVGAWERGSVGAAVLLDTNALSELRSLNLPDFDGVQESLEIVFIQGKQFPDS
jgi:hypothetical protein